MWQINSYNHRRGHLMITLSGWAVQMSNWEEGSDSQVKDAGVLREGGTGLRLPGAVAWLWQGGGEHLLRSHQLRHALDEQTDWQRTGMLIVEPCVWQSRFQFTYISFVIILFIVIVFYRSGRNSMTKTNEKKKILLSTVLILWLYLSEEIFLS